MLKQIWIILISLTVLANFTLASIHGFHGEHIKAIYNLAWATAIMVVHK